MASRILNPQRREVVVRGDGNCFYRAITLWNDEISDEKHEEIRTLSSSLIERKTKVFEPLLFSSNSVEDHVKNSKITGALAETGHLQLRIAPRSTHLHLFIVAENMVHL